jgi:hypothetical protein
MNEGLILPVSAPHRAHYVSRKRSRQTEPSRRQVMSVAADRPFRDFMVQSISHLPLRLCLQFHPGGVG